MKQNKDQSTSKIVQSTRFQRKNQNYTPRNDQIPPLIRINSKQGLNTVKPIIRQTPIVSLNESQVESEYVYESGRENRYNSNSPPAKMQSVIKLIPLEYSSDILNIKPVLIATDRQAKSNSSPEKSQKMESNYHEQNKIHNLHRFAQKQDGANPKQQFGQRQKQQVVKNQRHQNGKMATISKNSEQLEIQSNFAVKLFRDIVYTEQNLKDDDFFERTMQKDLAWMISKTPLDLISSIVSNPIKLNVYLKILRAGIIKQRKIKLFNQANQVQEYTYNERIQEIYELLSCLIIKMMAINSNLLSLEGQKVLDFRVDSPKNISRIKKYTSSINKKNLPEIYIHQNGAKIELDPQSNAIKRRNALKINELKNKIKQKQKQMSDIKVQYETIIQNYAHSLENISVHSFARQSQTNYYQHQKDDTNLLFGNKLVSKRYDSQNQEQIRNKNHTFGGTNKAPSRQSLVHIFQDDC